MAKYTDKSSEKSTKKYSRDYSKASPVKPDIRREEMVVETKTDYQVYLEDLEKEKEEVIKQQTGAGGSTTQNSTSTSNSTSGSQTNEGPQTENRGSVQYTNWDTPGGSTEPAMFVIPTNYECTLLGCVASNSGQYGSLGACQSVCVGWGCPPQLNSNTDILFVYDNSGSYSVNSHMGNIFKATTAWTQTLAAAGWTGNQSHTTSAWNYGYYTGDYANSDWGLMSQLSETYFQDINTLTWEKSDIGAESWLGWGAVPYFMDKAGYLFCEPSWTVGACPSLVSATWGIDDATLEQYWHKYIAKPALKNYPNTGGTYPTNDVLVVSFCHESSEYTSTPTVKFKNQYALWDSIWDNRTANFTPKGFLFTLDTGGGPYCCDNNAALVETPVEGLLSIYKGNQADVINGGTGVNDGTWINIPLGQPVPNAYGVCGSPPMPNNEYSPIGNGPTWAEGCSTAPGGLGTSNPCIVNTSIGPSAKLCPGSNIAVVGNNGNISNPYWVGGVPTWGALVDKGWAAKVDEIIYIDQTLVTQELSSSIGVISTPATICLSAETLWNDAWQVDYPYQTEQSCGAVCFPLLDPWYCDGLGTPCYQDPAGQFDFGPPPATYLTTIDAYEACTGQCNTVSAWTCGLYGCTEDSGGTFSSLSSCTASCQSYDCTINGCYGPQIGTGSTGSFLDMSACTASCSHYECVTDDYAQQVLPNIYMTSANTNNGCIQVSGSVDPSVTQFQQFTSLTECTGSCVSWGCCEPLGITDNSTMYVYYDITSMDSSQTEKAVKGIIDWTEAHPDFTGHVYHLLWWTERWLTYPTYPYTKDIYRFTDSGAGAGAPTNSDSGVYPVKANFAGANTYGHGATYWTGTGSPAYVLKTMYPYGPSTSTAATATTGFYSWTAPASYSGSATHTIHDNFTPGYELGQKVAAATGWYTRGEEIVQKASYTDDVINIVFQDESYLHYHNRVSHSSQSSSFAGQVEQTYKDDHALYFLHRNAVTATTMNGGLGGTIRSLMYPTASLSTAHGALAGFALHAVAAISSGDQPTPNGKWSASTYPLDNAGLATPYTHEQCKYSLSSLVTQNPYWSVNVPTWGGLDQFGWFINFAFATYSQAVFENDLTDFLTSTTISCSTICMSAQTAPTPDYPYSAETECDSGCVEFNCGNMGCYSAVTGDYSSLSACTASCESYDCSSQGCIEYNQPTGTTFPVHQIDGISYDSYYGSGGTFSSVTDCDLICYSWECGTDGCYYNPGGTASTYSSQTQCENGDVTQGLLACSGYNCTNLGCVEEVGNDYDYYLESDCNANCLYWECTPVLGCISQSGTPTGSIYEFASASACSVYCASFNCNNNGCYQLNDLSGTYQDITQLPVVSSAACTASCVSYNCTDTGCTDQTGTGGTYTTNFICEESCRSYTCTTYGCNVYNAPNYGTGGTFMDASACTDTCLHWECGCEGCLSYIGTGGSYSSLAECLDVGFDPVTGSCTTWDCTAMGCIPLTGSCGQFSSMSSCTGTCTSYSCGTGTYTPPEGGERAGHIGTWTGGGCGLFNIPNYGTGGTYVHEWQCTGGCRSWDCTFSGCNDVSAGAGSGGTYLSVLDCRSGCSSYNCTDTGCVGIVGSGGTWFSSVNPIWGYTGCTGTCLSFNCANWGCLPAQIGSGGTYWNSTSSASSLTACTTACTSYDCYTAGCQTYNSNNGYGTGGTYSSITACTACTNAGTDIFADDCACISWGCLNNPIPVDTNIYAYYDTTSMGITAIKEAIIGLEGWVSTIQNFGGNIYHTTVRDERWLSWASSVYVGVITGGTQTINQDNVAKQVRIWAYGYGLTNLYDNFLPGQLVSANNYTTGPPPSAATNDNVLAITFIDESGNSGFGSLPNVYTSSNAGSSNNSIPNFTATVPEPNDQPSPTWVVDYSAYSATYATVLAGTGSLTCFVYPTISSNPQTPDNQIFALHVVGAIDTGNQTPGLQGENWQPGTAPRRTLSGGVQGSVPDLCGLADLTALEISNPYLTYPIGNVGLLDQQGWGYNVAFQSYTPASFENDLGVFLSTVSSNNSECVSAQTSPTTQYPYVHFSACTAECYSWECTYTGCIPHNGTGGTPTYYTTLNACQNACTSWNCTNTGCTEQTGTGGTWTTGSGSCITACTSYNCEDITTYTPSVSWPIAPGCIEQIGSGGTYYQAAVGTSGSSMYGYTACTDECTSWTCIVNCTGGTTGCTEWPNTAATYTSSTACTNSCAINWYCTEEHNASTCDGKIIIGQPGGIINNGYSVESPATISSGYGALGWFADNNQTGTWANYSFSMIASSPPIKARCPGPWIASDVPWGGGSFQYPGELHVLNNVTFNPLGTFSSSVSWPRTYTDWSSLVNDFVGLGVNINSTMNASLVFTTIMATNPLWESLGVVYDVSPCLCYTVPCDVFCDDGINVIPSTALGPYATSGMAETNCCPQITWSCKSETRIDSCSGKTTLPGQYASNTDAWDWLTVNLPNALLTTLKYESIVPAINISGACEGPNGGALYDVAPVSYALLNPNVSYNNWNLFISQLQATGTVGVLSGMSYSNVNQYVYAQSGETIQICQEICHCSVIPCDCIEIEDNQNPGPYATQADCLSGTTTLEACCPNTGTTTGTSWECTSGITWNPICDNKPYIGDFTDQFVAVDNFRTTNPTGIFGQKRFTHTWVINNNGVSVATTPYTWLEVWSSISASSTANGFKWESCYKEFTTQWAGSVQIYQPYKYIKTISHPAISGGTLYTTWDSFYTASVATYPSLPTSYTTLQVCQEIDSAYWGNNQFGCVVDMMKCCNRDDCYCYETYTTGGTFSTEAPCISACCPTNYSGWTCEYIDPFTNTSSYTLPCYFISQSSPITIPALVFYDTSTSTGQYTCNNSPTICPEERVTDYWSCVTTMVNTCDPNGDSLGEVTGTTNGPAIAINGVQYPFSSSTDQLYPLLPTYLGSIYGLGGYGQAETILTDYHYFNPSLPLSSTTFQLGSLDSSGQIMVNPDSNAASLPLPYVLPAETCYGKNASGGTGMPMFSFLSVSHSYVNNNTPYYSWGEFISAAVIDGYQVSTATTVADFGFAYPALFGCSHTTISNQQPPAQYPDYAWSGCNWHFELLPCLCDTSCCCETGFTSGYNTQLECEDPISGCCPEISSYICNISGCIDPGNGSGQFTGPTALADCQAVCNEWKCISSTTITNTCIDKVVIPPSGTLPNITEFTPSFNSFNTGPWDALAYFADPTNLLQGQSFINYKWECGQGCGWSINDCDGPNGAYKTINSISIQIVNSNSTTVFNSPYTDWASLIVDLTTNLGNFFNLGMLYNEVAEILYNGIPGEIWGGIDGPKYEIIPSIGSCFCTAGPCGCVLTGGTGHTDTFHLNNLTQCEYDCCSGITIPECGILITGQEEGVLYYDFDTNTTTKLFDEPGWQKLDIAARQNKLWIYRSGGPVDLIREYDVVWAPFQKIFNRDITVPYGTSGQIGRGLTPTENPNILLTATDTVYSLDISSNVATATALFALPSGLTCTGDIMYDSTNGGMVITYGTGSSQYVGKFDGTNPTPIEQSHINLTTLGIGTGETIDSLFNYGTWTTSAGGGYTYFDAPYNGPIYGITTSRRVIELLINPLQFAPVETQTLPLVNQITNNVHGATNILNIVNGQTHDCVDINVYFGNYWCDGLLGCLSYPPNITPPNSFGPHNSLQDCEDNCNFVCGDCVLSCECTLVTNPVGSGCHPEPTMADCVLNNQSNPNTLYGGEGCCDCFGCVRVVYYGWSYSTSQWIQYVVVCNVAFGNFANTWNASGSYNSGDVVKHIGPNGDECCYTYVNSLLPNSGSDPYSEWTYYKNNYANNIGQDANKIYWIPCDEDCPTNITWDCVSGTTGSVQDTCANAIPMNVQGLSYTPLIEHIAGVGYSLWHKPFEEMKWDCGSQQNPLPPNPCVAPMAHWAKILGCRIVHIGNSTPTPAESVIQTTWADFIDHINGLFGGGVYTFSYSNRWQDLEAGLGNHVGMECIWEYCECTTLSGPPICYMCDSNIMNYYWLNIPTTVPMIDISATYNGSALNSTANPIVNLPDDAKAAVDIITNPNNGLFQIDTREMKWEKMPANGSGGAPMLPGPATTCTPNRYQQNGWTDCDLYEYGFGPDGGNYFKLEYGFWLGGGYFGGGTTMNQWTTWSDLLSDVSAVINASPGIPNSSIVTASDTFDEVNVKIGWYYTNILGLTAAQAESSWMWDYRPLCGCTGGTSNQPCHCEPVNGPGGAYPTSAACEEVCCSAQTSWECQPGSVIPWENSVECSTRINYLPIPLTTNSVTSPNSPLGYISDQVNGFQSANLSTLKFVQVNSTITLVADPCYDVDEVMTPDGVAFWSYITQINTSSQNGTPIVSTLSWKDFITQLQSPPHNLPVTLQMTTLMVFSTLQSNNFGGLGYTHTACYCDGSPCSCVEIPGTFGYPTQASCEVVCCSSTTANTLYQCTISGCLQTPNGTYTSLVDCETACQEWECVATTCYGTCDTVGVGAPRIALPNYVFGTLDEIMPYFADPATVPLQSPLLPTIVGNMQNTSIEYYKFDCQTCPQTSNICSSPHGSWYAPASIYVKNLPSLPNMTFSGPHDTWVETVDGLNQIGYAFNYNTPFSTIESLIAADGKRIQVMGESCFGTNGPCDCLPLDGTGHTGTWAFSDYNLCYTSCCQTVDTWDCTLGGCILSTNGTGQYNSLPSCQAVCNEYQCIGGTNQSDSCSGETFLNVDWSALPPLAGFFDQKQMTYFADPANGQQYQDVRVYKWINDQGTVSSNPNECTLTVSQTGTTNEYAYRKFTGIVTTNNTFSSGNAAIPTALNWDPNANNGQGGCVANVGGTNISSCVFKCWADLVSGLQMLGIQNLLNNGAPLTLNDSFGDIRFAISHHFGVVGSVLRLYSFPCYCYGSACSCLTVPGTGHTGNFYSNINDCNVAAAANPCCTPPDDKWYCQPFHSNHGGTNTCTCIQGPAGIYPTLLDCKNDAGNCCDPHYYDCINQGTPQAGCVGLSLPQTGPYQTAAACDHECPKLGYNCEHSDGPGGSGIIGCIPCIGNACQYTYISAGGSPYYGDALAQCQASCPPEAPCWKCCMDKNGWITQLSPTLQGKECTCPIGSIEVLCTGHVPCEFPVSCMPGYVYDWALCQCVCEQDMECIVGYHWSHKECKCVPNYSGPVDFVGPQGQVLEQISQFLYQPVRTIITKFVDGVDLLEYYRKYNLIGSECTHCTDGTQGICVLDGCLYFTDYDKDGATRVGWKSLLVNGNESLLVETGIPTIPSSTTTPSLPGAMGQGYSCVVNPNNPPSYTECIQSGTDKYISYFGTTAPQYATLQDCYNEGCDDSTVTYYMCTTQLNSLVGENQQACVPVEGIGGIGMFTTLQDCLNNGCGGWMTCNPSQVTQVNGVTVEANYLYPIPMCCESYINSSTTPLTITTCTSNCGMNEVWFPLYNVIGLNTYYESPLAYLIRELNPYIRDNSCIVALSPDSLVSTGLIKKAIYTINY